MSDDFRAAGGGAKPVITGEMKSSVTRAVSPPDNLIGDRAVDAWKRTIRILIDQGTFEMQDCYLLTEYCNTIQLLHNANQIIKDDGFGEETGTGGDKLNSATKARDKSISQLMRLQVVLKLDANSRIRRGGSGGNKTKGSAGNAFSEF